VTDVASVIESLQSQPWRREGEGRGGERGREKRGKKKAGSE